MDTRYTGGALFIRGGDSRVYMDTVTFCNNEATQEGGAIDISWRTRYVEILNGKFYNNQALGYLLPDGDADGDGGAISASNTYIVIEDSTFAYNVAHRGGAIRNSQGDLYVRNSVFSHNRGYIASWDATGDETEGTYILKHVYCRLHVQYLQIIACI